jgi:iron complex outermembrane receptor protein
MAFIDFFPNCFVYFCGVNIVFLTLNELSLYIVVAGINCFTNKSNVYFTVGQSFREPTRTNMFNGGDSPSMFNFNTGSIYGFTNVKPEKVVDYEFGVKHTSNKLVLQANLFYMNFSNEILPSGGTAANAVSNSVSAPNSHRKGLEIDMKYKITDNLTFDYNQSLTYTKFEDYANPEGKNITPAPKFVNEAGSGLGVVS